MKNHTNRFKIMNNAIKCSLKLLAFAGVILCSSFSQAHAPLFDCFNEDDNTVVCEAGFSDGASAEGIEIRLLNAQGRVLEQKELGKDGSVTFKRPDEEFSVVFSAGEGHVITVIGDDIY